MGGGGGVVWGRGHIGLKHGSMDWVKDFRLDLDLGGGVGGLWKG